MVSFGHPTGQDEAPAQLTGPAHRYADRLRSLRQRQTEFERQQYRLSLPQLIHRSGLNNELLCTLKNLTTRRLTNHRAPPLHGRCAYYYTIELEME